MLRYRYHDCRLLLGLVQAVKIIWLEGAYVDQGQDVSRFPGQDITLAAECDSCAIARGVASQRTQGVATYVAEDVAEDAVVISGPELDGLVVVPRQHIGGLQELPDVRRARVLAALRRATQSVRERNPGSATSVVVMTGPPASEGHVCFHVLPDDSEDPDSSTSTHA
jgi:diadenosine tetraphosphate (Ap4A) HIT family hydrolase